MATKVTILGDEQKKTGKPIEFVKVVQMLAGELVMSSTPIKPTCWDNIELVSRGSNQGGFDIMFAYSNNARDTGLIYYGYFNDGFVE